MEEFTLKRVNSASSVLTILLLTLLFASVIRVVGALNIHYELDKQFYYSGDGGKLLLVVKNEVPEDIYIFKAEMNITGIGIFAWNGTGLPEATNLPSSVHAYLLKGGQSANIEIFFRIPADVHPGEYEYTWSITSSYSPFPGKPDIHSDRLRIIAVGEKPPSQFNPLLLMFIVPIVLLAVYPMARWRSPKAAKIVLIAAVAAAGLSVLLGGFPFFFLMFMLWPILAILIIIAAAVSIVCSRRGKNKAAKPPAPSGGAISTCLKCGRDLSQFPADIKNCPYCGERVSVQQVKATRVGPVKAEAKLPKDVKGVRRYAKRGALLGLLIALISFVLGPFLGGLMGPERTYIFPILHELQDEIGNGVVIGIFVTIVSALVWAAAAAFKVKGGEKLS